MKGLTLHQPWAWAVTDLGKDVENRMWPPPAHAIRREIAIHAGLRIDAGAVLHLRECGYDPPTQGWARGVVVAVAILGGVRAPYSGDGGWHEFGCWGWVLANVRVLREPVRCLGAQGLWTLPPDVEAAVRRQLEEVRRA